VELSEIYRSHPLNKRSILARLERQGIDLREATAWSLAVDPDGEITDQNHSGGAQAVLRLAAASRVTCASYIIDVGAGLGGSARVLAAAFGCAVLGIERDGTRCRDAVELTTLVRLADRVTMVERDALTGAGDIRGANVLWGQSAWVHFPNPEQFLGAWLPAIKDDGRVAMSDAFLLRDPANSDERALIHRLDELWGAHLVPVDGWRSALEGHKCQVVHVRNLTLEATLHFHNLKSAAWPVDGVTATERESWTTAIDAIGRGLVGFFQMVALRRG
jgi:SAM-dependent methyltransferase